MSMNGFFEVKYKGKNFDRFLKLFKIMTPYAELNFNVDKISSNEEGIIISQKAMDFPWYTAIYDLKALTSYLEEDDKVTLDYNIECDYQIGDIVFTKKGDEVDIKENGPTKNIGCYNYLFFLEYLQYIITPDEEDYRHRDPFSLDLFSLDAFTRYLANVIDNDEELIPIIKDFIYKNLDSENIRDFEKKRNREFTEEEKERLQKFRENFITIESTRELLKSEKEKGLIYIVPKYALPKLINEYQDEAAECMGDIARLQTFIDKKSHNYYGGSTIWNRTKPEEYESIKTILNLCGYVIDRNLIVYDKEGKIIKSIISAGGKIYPEKGLSIDFQAHDSDSGTTHSFYIRPIGVHITLDLLNHNQIREHDTIYDKVEININNNRNNLSFSIGLGNSYYSDEYELKISLTGPNGKEAELNFYENNYIGGTYQKNGEVYYAKHIFANYGLFSDGDKVKWHAAQPSVKEFIVYASDVFEQILPGIKENLLNKLPAYKKVISEKTVENMEMDDELKKYGITFPYWGRLRELFPLKDESKTQNHRCL